MGNSIPMFCASLKIKTKKHTPAKTKKSMLETKSKKKNSSYKKSYGIREI